jgi:alanine dehydrogenase
VKTNPEIKLGLNILDGKITYKGVAEAFGLEYRPVEELIN